MASVAASAIDQRVCRTLPARRRGSRCLRCTRLPRTSTRRAQMRRRGSHAPSAVLGGGAICHCLGRIARTMTAWCCRCSIRRKRTGSRLVRIRRLHRSARAASEAYQDLHPSICLEVFHSETPMPMPSPASPANAPAQPAPLFDNPGLPFEAVSPLLAMPNAPMPPPRPAAAACQPPWSHCASQSSFCIPAVSIQLGSA